MKSKIENLIETSKTILFIIFFPIIEIGEVFFKICKGILFVLLFPVVVYFIWKEMTKAEPTIIKDKDGNVIYNSVLDRNFII